MEEAEISLEGLHEDVHHRAEHGGERWVAWVALSTAIGNRNFFLLTGIFIRLS